MNERIKSLIERAEYQAKKQSGYEDWEVSVEPSREQIFEKFAELIVLECAEIADNADATREKWEGIGKYVREHFGVKS
jgi:hypothetical protein